jgi:ribulose bisphosphate carboxylase small subunit
MYFTILDSGGPVACGDSLYAIYTGHVRTGNTEEDIQIALDSLFSSGPYFGNFYNAVYPNNFRVQSVDFKQSTGRADIVLNGGYVKPADYCDSRRYREQIWATARRFPEVQRISISLTNGILLGDLLAAFTGK